MAALSKKPQENSGLSSSCQHANAATCVNCATATSDAERSNLVSYTDTSIVASFAYAHAHACRCRYGRSTERLPFFGKNAAVVVVVAYLPVVREIYANDASEMHAANDLRTGNRTYARSHLGMSAALLALRCKLLRVRVLAEIVSTCSMCVCVFVYAARHRAHLTT